MNAATETPWAEANQRYLEAHLARLRRRLEGQAGDADETAADNLAAAMDEPPALVSLCQNFGLSPFERDVMLLAAGPELDSRFAASLDASRGVSEAGAVSFSLALEVLADGHWSALSPDAPLRRWRMIEIAGDTGTANPITGGALRLDERILHHLVGVSYLEERLRGWIEPVTASVEVTASQHRLAHRLAKIWAQAAGQEALPAIELTGTGDARRAVAIAVCSALGLALHQGDRAALPTGTTELEGLARLWQREAALSGSALYLDCGDGEGDDPQRDQAVIRLVDTVLAPIIVGSSELQRSGQRPVLSFAVSTPATAEQLDLWREALGDELVQSLDGRLEMLAGQFRLGVTGLHAAASEALGRSPTGNPTPQNTSDGRERFAETLWQACRRQARPNLGHLAQAVEPLATWDDIVLPQRELAVLREIAVHVRQRTTVYDHWGFGARSNRGLGVSALFAGTSGTGKTMAAEVLANELQLDLYRIDLSSVISKYIGETEKNLRRVFDAAEQGGAILLFDEADALFGKRSEVKDSHDRYANIEVSYLLQRMESYGGLAILTTNRKNALDNAFLRRLRFVVEFPFPDPAARREVWCRIFPPETPTAELDGERLSRLNVAGGSIRNIALGAAFRAAEAGRGVAMEDVLEAARFEYMKLEKPLSEAELRGWLS